MFRAIRPADQANCSRNLLRRSNGLFDGSGTFSSGIANRGSAFSSGIANRSSAIGSDIANRSSAISHRISSRIHSRSSFFLGATGAQHQGNRNGAPNLCIHRQLPQFVQ